MELLKQAFYPQFHVYKCTDYAYIKHLQIHHTHTHTHAYNSSQACTAQRQRYRVYFHKCKLIIQDYCNKTKNR